MDTNTIAEMIVVEGKNDTHTLKRMFDCDTIETNGSAITETTLKKIRYALEKRGVIIFTDPDYPGEKIRKTIDQYVPGCKHAFLAKEVAIDYQKNKVGIEHAIKEDLFHALLQAKPSFSDHLADSEEIGREQLYERGFIAGQDSKRKRELLGTELNIGYTNGKQLYKRLRQFRVSQTEFNEALIKVERKLNQ